MPRELDGQVAIVTGGGRGFGKAIALRYAAEGAYVVVVSRTKGELDEVVAEIQAAGGHGLAIAADVTSRPDVARVIEATEAAFGGVSLLVSNAGVAGPFGPIWGTDPDEWWAAQAVHIRAPVLFMHAVMPAMLARKNGRIILVSAVASHRVAPYLSAYCVGKQAQVRLAEHAAAEAKEHGVSVFAIDPGYVVTKLAEDTMNAPDAQRWLPGMVERLRAKTARDEPPADLERCAQRCLDLASGRYDGLSGKYMELDDDLDIMLQPAAHH